MKLEMKIAQKEQGLLCAWCPSLPGCVVSARTVAEAQVAMRKAVSGYLASMDASVPFSVDVTMPCSRKAGVA